MSGETSGVKDWGALRSRRLPIALAIILMCAGTMPVPAEPEIIATFQEATRLATDPLGNIYVIDRGAGRLIRVGTDGGRIEIGGPGADVPEPAAVDPTNGLFIVVGDRASGGLFQFSRDMAPIGPLGSGTVRAPLSGRDEVSDLRSASSLGYGRTTVDDIAVGSEGGIFILDRQARHVVRLDPYYRVERVIGGFDEGSDALSEPVSLCIDDEGTLYVADGGTREVVAFDMHGSRTSSLQLMGEEPIYAIRCDADRRVVVRPAAVDILTGTEMRQIIVKVSDGTELRDVARLGDDVLLLTRRHLYRMVLPTEFRAAVE